jgi:hypothetical protein
MSAWRTRYVNSSLETRVVPRFDMCIVSNNGSIRFSHTYQLRALFYIFMLAVQDIKIQKKGIVLITFGLEFGISVCDEIE